MLQLSVTDYRGTTCRESEPNFLSCFAQPGGIPHLARGRAEHVRDYTIWVLPFNLGAAHQRERRCWGDDRIQTRTAVRKRVLRLRVSALYVAGVASYWHDQAMNGWWNGPLPRPRARTRCARDLASAAEPQLLSWPNYIFHFLVCQDDNSPKKCIVQPVQPDRAPPAAACIGRWPLGKFVKNIVDFSSLIGANNGDYRSALVPLCTRSAATVQHGT